MRSVFKKVGIVAVASLALGVALILSSSTADAHRRWGGGGAAFVGGVAIGALAAPRYSGGFGYGYPAYSGGYYGGGYRYPAYSAGYYGGDCFIRRRVVGYDYHGRPIVRVRRVCY